MHKLRYKPGTVTADKVQLCWNPGTSEVALTPWPNPERVGKHLRFSSLACHPHVREMSFEQRKAFVFMEAMHLIVRDQCDPIAVHQALIGLKEYCAGCSPDMPVWDEGQEYPLIRLMPDEL